jgi:TPR repeat protein
VGETRKLAAILVSDVVGAAVRAAIAVLLLSPDIVRAGTSEDCAAANDQLDYTEALRLCRPLAEQGDDVAQTTLGLMYEHGQGVTHDDAEAAKWYRKAAERDNAVAQERLGSLYEHGQGVTHDDAEAVKWYRKAAERDVVNAQIELGIMYEDSRGGVVQDYAAAVKWYRRAAEQGSADAQATLGFRYEHGQGVPQDYVLAHLWLSLAAANGYPCGDKRDNLATKMTPDQITEAERLAREWKPTK